MDQFLYMESCQSLEGQIRRLRQERNRILSRREDKQLTRLKELLDWLQRQNGIMLQFDEKAFEGIVEKVVVWADGNIKIYLKCGLELPERIARDKRCR